MALDVQGSESLFWKTGLDLKGLKSGTMGATNLIAGMKKNITAMHVFAGLGISAGIVFGVISKKAYAFAKEFEHAMKEVMTISDAVKDNFKGISDEVVEMSRTVPDSAAKLTKALYQIVSAGYDGAKALDILRVSAELAMATVTETEVAADAMTYVMNSFGAAAGNAENIAGKLFKTIELGKVKMEELSPAVAKVAGMWAQAGGSFEDLMTTIAVGVKALPIDIMATGIRGILTAIIKPTEDAQKVIKELGIEFDAATLASKGFTHLLFEMKRAVGEDADKIEKLAAIFPNVRGLIGALALDTKKYTAALEEMSTGTEAFRTATQIMVKDTTNQMAILKNNIDAKLKPLGDALLGVTNKLVTGINDMFAKTDDALRYMSKSLEEAAIAIESQRDQVHGLIDTIAELLDVEKLNEDQTYELKAAKEALAIFYPELIAAINEETDAIEFGSLAMEARLELDRNALEMRKAFAEANYKIAQMDLEIYEAQKDRTGERVKDTERALDKQRKLIEDHARHLRRFIEKQELEVPIIGVPLIPEAQIRAFKERYAKLMGISISEVSKLIETRTSEVEILAILEKKNADYVIAMSENTKAVYQNVKHHQGLQIELNKTKAIFDAYGKALENLTDTQIKEHAKSLYALRKSFEAQKITVKEYTERLGLLKIELQLYPDLVKQIDAQMAAISKKKGVVGVGVAVDEEAMKRAAALQDKVFEDILEKMKTFEEKKADIEAKYDIARKEALERYAGDEEEAMLKRLDITEKEQIEKLRIAEEEQIEKLRIEEETAELTRELKEAEMVLESEFRAAQFHQREQDFIESLGREIEDFKGNIEIKKLMIEFLSRAKRRALDLDYQNFRKMDNQELKDFIQTQRKKIELLDKSSQLYKIETEKLEKALSELWKRQEEKIEKVADAIRKLGDFISEFDDELGELVYTVSDVARDLGNLIQAINIKDIFTGVGAILGIFASVLGLFDTIEETTKNVKTMMELLNETIKEQERLLRFLYGAERLRAMEEYLIILQEMYERWTKIREAMTWWSEEQEEAYQQLEDEIKELIIAIKELETAVILPNIADVIAEGFREGKSSAEDFASFTAKTFEEMMSDAMVNIFKRKIVTDVISKWYEQFAEFAKEGLTADEIAALRESWIEAMEQAREDWDAFSEIAEAAGISMLEGLGLEEEPRGMRGAIKAITEETAGILAGQFAAVRINVLQSLGEIRIININMTTMIDIATNNWQANERTADNTDDIPRILALLQRGSAFNQAQYLKSEG